MRKKSCLLIIVLLSIFVSHNTEISGEGLNPKLKLNPFEHQVSEQLDKLKSDSAYTRAGAAESIGFLRAYSAADELSKALKYDSKPVVRREAAMALAWCGARKHVEFLLDALNDPDWVVRQSSWVTLTNLTGMEFPFDALASYSVQKQQIEKWRTWWSSIPENRAPQDVFELVKSSDNEKRLRGVRALGSFGGEGASEAIIGVLRLYLKREYTRLDSLEKHLVQSCLRSLGRLDDQASYNLLLEFFYNEDWARHAADALADLGNSEVIPLLIEAYPKYARPINGKIEEPIAAPEDDNFVGDNMQDRMYETPYAIASTLSRLSWDNSKDRESLHKIVPHLVSNLPTDYDGAMIYDVEADQLITCYLLEIAGCRQMVCDAAFRSAAHPDKWVQHKPFKVEDQSVEELLEMLAKEIFGDVPYMAAWFPAFCKENDAPRLIQLLDHESGWIRINAAKALMFLDSKDAVEPIGRLLVASHPEADYGFSGALEHSEYDDPTPRWREAFIRALGRLKATEHTDMLIRILEDERNVLEIQYAAAVALEEIGTPEAFKALKIAEGNHPFHSVRLIAREALWRRRPILNNTSSMVPFEPVEPQLLKARPKQQAKPPEAIVFIKGNNKVRSNFNGQAGVDPWRQTYVVTNSGPAMRIGRNLHILRPAKPDGTVTALTNFTQGF
ncbi:MAG: HEAT repeat domain-containing protein, partial [Planctomycetota bacterium]